MSSKVVVLDESGKQKGHALLSVGGFVADVDGVLGIEDRWRAAKTESDLDPDAPIKYTGDWPDRSKRAALIDVIGKLPIAGVAALLEDFRPKRMLLSKETRADRYVHLSGFEYVLQRVVQDLYLRQARGPHLVLFDKRDDLDEFQKLYTRVHGAGWEFPSGNTLPSLASRGFTRMCCGVCGGPLVEIADMIVSAMTRWATARCAVHKGATVEELGELDHACAALAPLFPTTGMSIPPRRQGRSIVTHARNLKEKELLRDNIDRWIHEATEQVDRVAPVTSQIVDPDDIPF